MKSGETSHVTLTRVAAEAGVSLATTSYSLRNDPRIPRATAARVQAVAKRLGYRPNPRVSALMAHIRDGRPVTVGERIAFLWIDAAPGERPYGTIFDAVKKRAAQLGYTLDEFWYLAPGVPSRRLQQILYSRGIVGLLISPKCQPNPKFKIDWNWNLFSSAVIGTAECDPELHHSAHYHYGGMRLAMTQLQTMGKRRIAALLDMRIEDRARRSWSAAFLAHHPMMSDGWKLLGREDPEKPSLIVAWLRRCKPDAIVAVRRNLDILLDYGWRPSLKTTVVLLDWNPNAWGFGGVDQCEDVVAMNAVDLVAGQLQRNERGVPADVKMLLSVGRWARATKPVFLGKKKSFLPLKISASFLSWSISDWFINTNAFLRPQPSSYKCARILLDARGAQIQPSRTSVK